MLVKEVKLTLLKVTHKEGTAKASGKPYDFYVASVVDEDANVFGFNLADEALPPKADLPEFLEVKNVQVVADIKITPKGFDCGGQIVSLEVQ